MEKVVFHAQTKIKLTQFGKERERKKQVSRPLVKGVFRGVQVYKRKLYNRPSGESVKSPEALKLKRKKK